MRIRVATLTQGPWCITAEDAEQLYQHLIAALTIADVVELDFDGTACWSAPFFSVAVGTLTRDFSDQELSRRLRVINLREDVVSILRRVLEASREYFHNDLVRAYIDGRSLEDPCSL